VKEVAFDTDENMLVCAPTGAGKTNVALLTILREFDKTFDHATKRSGDFKIVYISPLKALATEIVEKFSSKLGHAGVVVKEFTGDMSLTKQELLETHIIVSTPEKWDVMTRKSDSITELVNMIIIDEIHLLDEERGRVLECIVARTTITIERKQKNIRLVGLSATLPNYIEVASFMQVKKGLFYFNETYRPVPLYKKFIGVRNPREQSKPNDGTKKTKKNRGPDQNQVMHEVLFDIVKDNLLRNEQVLIFVHSRKETVKTGMVLLEMAAASGDSRLFAKPLTPINENQLVNKDLKALVSKGIGSHNAGLCRKDRRMIETGFLNGSLRLVVCTATLAWGVNLPAHTVIIKGTDVYEPGVGFKDLSILDVQQIFGRAGRPQFDSYGEAILITKIERLNYFMGMMTLKTGVRSQFDGIILEALNAEIALGNITTLSEAYDYLKRTFYYVRVKKQPRLLGAENSQQAEEKIHNLIEEKLDYLNELKFIRYDRHNLILESTELGVICSHFYVNCATMEKFCKYLNFYEDLNLLSHENNRASVDAQGDIEDQDLLAILAQASEFEQLQVRPEEAEELEKCTKQCEFLEPVHPEFKKLLGKMEKKMEKKEFDAFKDGMMAESGGKEERQLGSYEKVMILIQGYLGMQAYDNYSLVADTHYIVQNGTRILRCLYEICLKKNIAFLSMTVLRMCRYIENNIRDDLTCLRMFCFENVKRGILSIRRGQDIKESKFFLDDLTCKKIEGKMYGEHANYNLYSSVRNLREENDIGFTLKLNHGEAYKLKKILWNYPIAQHRLCH
jgi:activating signal cointegrator complex subunit 3